MDRRRLPYIWATSSSSVQVAPTRKMKLFAVGSTWPSIIIGSYVAFGGILYGFDTGLISGIIAMQPFKNEYGIPSGDTYILPSNRKSLFVSILSAGLFVGALSNGYFADRFGRRFGLLLACCIFTFGVLLQVVKTSIPLFVVGRFFAGWGAGAVSSLGPLYQSEIAPKEIRGAIVAGYHQAITLGLFLAAVVNNSSKSHSGKAAYIIPISIQFVWAFMLIVGFFFLPESPRYFVKKGNVERARKSLSFIRNRPMDDPIVEEELLEIEANLEYEISIGRASVWECFRVRNHQLRRLVMGMALMAFQQLAGVNFIMYFGTDFFQKAGIKNSFVISMAINTVSVGTTLPSIFLVERMGRRSLLFYGAIGCFVTQYVVGIVGLVSTTLVAQKVLIAFSCLFMASFCVSWGPVPWVLVGEVFPLPTRARSVALSAATNYLFNFAIAYSTPYMVDKGPGKADMGSKVFFVWGSCCLAGAVFVYSFVFETKGLQLEQIDELYNTVHLAWRSTKFVPSPSIASDVVNVPDTEKMEMEVEKIEHV